MYCLPTNAEINQCINISFASLIEMIEGSIAGQRLHSNVILIPLKISISTNSRFSMTKTVSGNEIGDS